VLAAQVLRTAKPVILSIFAEQGMCHGSTAEGRGFSAVGPPRVLRNFRKTSG